MAPEPFIFHRMEPGDERFCILITVRQDIGSDAVGDLRFRGLDGIPCQMGVTRGGLHVGVAEQLADHGKTFAQRQGA